MRALAVLLLALTACDTLVDSSEEQGRFAGPMLFVELMDASGAVVMSGSSDALYPEPGETEQADFNFNLPGDLSDGTIRASCNGGPTDIDLLTYRITTSDEVLWMLSTTCIDRGDSGMWTRFEDGEPVADGTFITAVIVE